MTRPILFAGAALLTTAAITTEAAAETYQVGPDRSYQTIQDVLPMLGPGDVVEVDGGHSYPGDLWFRSDQSGTPDQPVVIRGIRAGGQRPIISGVGTEEWHDMVLLVYGNHITIEGFEILGDGNVDHDCVINKGDGTVLRDVLIHGCGGHGMLSTDDESGSLTMEYCELYDNGDGTQHHQIYATSDQSMYPGSVFRLQHSYIHDSRGGNNVKTRAERNEIYSNWIEAALYHELDLIGPDGGDPAAAREDSDVVGNVIVKGPDSTWRIARIGGDGTGSTAGRYRFVSNTMILNAASDRAITLQQEVESVEFHNNVVFRLGGGGGQLTNHTDPIGEAVWLGSNNWIQTGFSDVPAALTNNIDGDDPGFLDASAFDFRLTDASTLIDAGSSDTALTGAHEFPAPLALPTHVPAARSVAAEAELRNDDGAPDIGAYCLGSGSEPGVPPEPTPTPPGNPPGGDDAGAASPSDDSGCSCTAAGGRDADRSALWLLAAAGCFATRRRR